MNTRVPQELTLNALVEQITPENRHDEVGTGEAVGNESGSRDYVPERGDLSLVVRVPR